MPPRAASVVIVTSCDHGEAVRRASGRRWRGCGRWVGWPVVRAQPGDLRAARAGRRDGNAWAVWRYRTWPESVWAREGLSGRDRGDWVLAGAGSPTAPPAFAGGPWRDRDGVIEYAVPALALLRPGPCAQITRGPRTSAPHGQERVASPIVGNTHSQQRALGRTVGNPAGCEHQRGDGRAIFGAAWRPGRLPASA